MAASALVSGSQSQVSVDLTVETTGATATLSSVELDSEVGPARVVSIRLNVNGTTDLELLVTVRDDAFEEFDLYGGSRGEGSRMAEVTGLF
jgi:hypothetical protein